MVSTQRGLKGSHKAAASSAALVPPSASDPSVGPVFVQLPQDTLFQMHTAARR